MFHTSSIQLRIFGVFNKIAEMIEVTFEHKILAITRYHKTLRQTAVT